MIIKSITCVTSLMSTKEIQLTLPEIHESD